MKRKMTVRDCGYYICVYCGALDDPRNPAVNCAECGGPVEWQSYRATVFETPEEEPNEGKG